MKTLTSEQLALIKKPLPAEAIKPHPTKTYLSTIKAIYVTERLNDVFWVWEWQIRTSIEERADKWMVVVKVILQVPEYWIYYESFWGNDNWWEASKWFDLWDAYKWATTDAITKICSYIWIWIDVFKWKKTFESKTDKVEHEQKSEVKAEWIKWNSNICPSCTTENEIKENSKGNKYFKCCNCWALVSVTK